MSEEYKRWQACPKCGWVFVDAWERSRHYIGKHNYRSWTKQDAIRQAERMHKKQGRDT